ncbi:MAG: carcinine hydrolase/isopenicillin-N N-acyltransferase family protein [Gemmatimonadetes bacterium]|nr:carcinine hydrolase/isopenicillin-N N-acyltransferase family protein [Gemmatimonadota bacterium]
MCDTMVRVLPGRVLFAKNSDREADEPQVIEWHAARDHAPSDEVQCTWIAIPQERHTFATVISRPVWMWGAEIGANEHGVVIGNEAVFTKERVPSVGALTGMDLLRLALERATSAEDAVRVLVSLNARHGQGGRCGYEDTGFRYFSSFAVADPHSAWIVETAGRSVATERVTGVRTISNGLTIPGFAEAHGDLVRTRVSECGTRRARTTSSTSRADQLPDLMAALRDHGASAWPHYAALNGAMDAPCMHAGGLLAASQTTASWVSELTPEHTRHFVTGTSAPCLSLFKPVHVDEAFDTGPTPTTEPDDSLWWTHERLHRVVMRDPARLAPLFTGERDALEARWLAAGRADGATAWRESRAALDGWIARVDAAAHGTRDKRPWAARRYWNRRRHAGP